MQERVPIRKIARRQFTGRAISVVTVMQHLFEVSNHSCPSNVLRISWQAMADGLEVDVNRVEQESGLHPPSQAEWPRLLHCARTSAHGVGPVSQQDMDIDTKQACDALHEHTRPLTLTLSVY